MGNGNADINDVYNLIRETEKRDNDRHTAVCERLTAVEIKVAAIKQPCPQHSSLKEEVDLHLRTHREKSDDVQRDWRGLMFAVAGAVITFFVINHLLK